MNAGCLIVHRVRKSRDRLAAGLNFLAFGARVLAEEVDTVIVLASLPGVGIGPCPRQRPARLIRSGFSGQV
jgi:hypothetical protein